MDANDDQMAGDGEFSTSSSPIGPNGFDSCIVDEIGGDEDESCEIKTEDSEAVGEANAENTTSNEEKMETNMENSTIKEGNLETKTENSTGKEEKPENNTETKDCEVEVKWSEVMGQKGHRIRMKEKAERTGTDIDKNKIDLKEKDRRRTQSMMDKNKNPEKEKTSGEKGKESSNEVKIKKNNGRKNRRSAKQREQRRIQMKKYIEEKQELRRQKWAKRNPIPLMNNTDEVAIRFHQSKWNNNHQFHEMGPHDYEWADLMRGPPGWRLGNIDPRPEFLDWEIEMMERERMYEEHHHWEMENIGMRREGMYGIVPSWEFDERGRGHSFDRHPHPDFEFEIMDREHRIQRNVEMENLHHWEMENMNRRRDDENHRRWELENSDLRLRGIMDDQTGFDFDNMRPEKMMRHCNTEEQMSNFYNPLIRNPSRTCNVSENFDGMNQLPLRPNSSLKDRSDLEFIVPLMDKRIQSPGTSMENIVPDEFPLGQKLEKCPIPGCFIECNNLRFHAHLKHIPEIFKSVEDSDKMSQKHITPTRIAALRAIKLAILGPQGTFNALMDLVNGIGISQEDAEKENQLTSSHWAMVEVCHDQDWPCPKYFSLNPLNSPGALIHWRPLLILLSLLDDKRRQSILSAFPINIQTSENKNLGSGQSHLDKKSIPSLVPNYKTRPPSLLSVFDQTQVPNRSSDPNPRQHQMHIFNSDEMNQDQSLGNKKRRTRSRGRKRNKKSSGEHADSGTSKDKPSLLSISTRNENPNHLKKELNANSSFSMLYGIETQNKPIKGQKTGAEIFDQHFENRLCNQMSGQRSNNNSFGGCKPPRYLQKDISGHDENIGVEQSGSKRNQFSTQSRKNSRELGSGYQGYGSAAMNPSSNMFNQMNQAMDRAFNDEMIVYGGDSWSRRSDNQFRRSFDRSEGFYEDSDMRHSGGMFNDNIHNDMRGREMGWGMGTADMQYPGQW